MTWTRVVRGIGFVLLAGALGYPASAGDDRVETKLLPSEARASGSFGLGAALDGETAVVAAYDNTGPAVFVFERGDGAWEETQKLTGDEVGSTFGFQVAIDGDTLAATAPTEEIEGARTGAVYVFVRNDGVWERQDKLEPSDPHTGARFGYSVALEGDTLVVGDTWHDDTYDSQGVVYVYTRSGTEWTEQDRLTANDPAKADYFGSGVAVSGDTILVGARANDDPVNGAGSAYVFARSGDTWTQHQKLYDPSGWFEDQFGARVAMAGDWAMVAVPWDGNTYVTEGSVRVYKRDGVGVSFQQVLRSPEPRPAGNFGLALALTEDRMVIGEEGYDGLGIYTGRAHVFVRDGDSWVFDETLDAPDAAVWTVFGAEVGVTADVVLVTAPNANDPEINSGNAWIFDDTPQVVLSSAALVPTSVRVVLPAPGKKRRMPPGLRASGVIDTGPDTVDLTRACELQVGSALYAVPQMTVSRNGRTFTHEDDVVTFKVTTPRNECSRTTFALSIRDDLTGHVDPNGPLTLGFGSDDVETQAAIPLAGGRFRLASRPDVLGESVLHCIRARARLRGAGRDSFALTLRFGSDGVPPATAPDVLVGFGKPSAPPMVWSEDLDEGKFKLRRQRWIFTDRKAAGVRRVVLDYGRGLATIVAARCSLDEFEQGPNPLEITLGIDDVLRAVALRAAVRGRTLRY